MDKTELQSLQKPLEDRYRDNLVSALVTLCAEAQLDGEAIACSVATGRIQSPASRPPGLRGYPDGQTHPRPVDSDAAKVGASPNAALCGGLALRVAMSELDRRLLDGIRLTSGAYDAGQLAALRGAVEPVGNNLKRERGRVATAVDLVEKTKARGAIEALERILSDLEARIATIEAKLG